MAKYLMSEKTAAFVRGLMDRQSPDSARGRTRYNRPAFAVEDSFAHPFEVRFAASLGDGENSGSWIIWLPCGEEMLLVDGTPVDMTAELEAAGDPYPAGWFLLDDVLDADSGGDVYLNIHIPSDEEEEESGEEGVAAEPAEGEASEETSEVTAEFGSEPAEEESGEKVISILIAAVDGKSVIQNVDSAIILGTGSGGEVKVDEKSIDKEGATKEKPGEVLQIAAFNGTERDSGKGLSSRLKADPETGEITGQDSDGLMLLARKNGRIVYVPIDGDGEDPEDPEEPKDCDHDEESGNDGGVPADDGGLGWGWGGGVSGGGGYHPGDDDCNCDN